MQTVYIDELFLINFLVNYLTLLATAKISAEAVSRWLLALAALLGGAYAAAVVFPQLGFLGNPLIKLAAGVMMVLVAFGKRARLARITLIFFAVAALFGGAVFSLSIIGGGGVNTRFLPMDFKLLFLAFAICYVVVSLVFRRTAAKRAGGTAHITLRHEGRRIELAALVDTGNSLTDPMTGKKVIVADAERIKELFQSDTREKVAGVLRTDAVKALEELGAGFRLVPYNAVGVTGGMLVAFRPDGVEIDGKERTGMLVAISPNGVSDGGAYSALLGG